VKVQKNLLQLFSLLNNRHSRTRLVIVILGTFSRAALFMTSSAETIANRISG
jgi:hypothetical protein